MSAITIENDLVHYEVLGRGRPVIFVHGWLGSWRYWVPTMQQLSMKYRTYALDLWGFGDSGKESNKYGLKEQVKLLYDFMDKLGIAKAALVGHSLGAAICLRFASQYPDRAPRVMLVSPPLFDLGGLDEAPPAKPVVVTPTLTMAAVPASAGAVPVPAAQPATTAASTAPGNGAPAAGTPAAQPAATAASTAPATAATPAATTPAAQPTATPGTSAPAATTTPAATTPVAGAPTPQPAPAAQPATSAMPINGNAAAASAAPGTPVPAQTTTPTPATPAATTPSAQPATPAAPNTPATSTDTIPRNPFKGLGDTPEEILARLQAKNVVSTAGLGAPGTTPANPAKPAVAPVLPTNIGTPVQKPAAPSTPGTSTPAAPVLGKTDLPNPLLSILTGINPAALLTKHVERDAPDLDKLQAEVEKTDESAITKSAQSFTGINLAVDLQRLPSPTLVLHGKADPLLPAPTDDLLRMIMKYKPEGHLLAMIEPDLHHFPMLEITAKFNRLLMDFLEAQDLTNVQFKDQWVRTMR